MSTATLVTHNPKFDAKLTTLAALQALPEPVALGPMHKPVAHAALVHAIHQQIDQRGFMVKREQLALSAKGHALFGVMDLTATQGELLTDSQRGLSFGFRNSTDCSLGIQAVAGTRVFVCDNLALSGDLFAIKRKNTTGLDLGAAVATGFDKFLQHVTQFEIEITRLQGTVISDGQAKEVIFDAFNASIVPVRLFDDVSRFYFKPTDEQTDCQPRSLWGLHNAFTRAMKDLSPVRLFGANVSLGKLFGLRSKKD